MTEFEKDLTKAMRAAAEAVTVDQPTLADLHARAGAGRRSVPHTKVLWWLGGGVGLAAAFLVALLLRPEGSTVVVTDGGVSSTTATEDIVSTTRVVETTTITSEPGTVATTQEEVPAAVSPTQFIMLGGVVVGGWNGTDWVSQPPSLDEIRGATFVDATTGKDVVIDEPVAAEYCYAGSEGREFPSLWDYREPGNSVEPLAVQGLSWDARIDDFEMIQPAPAHVESVRAWLEQQGLEPGPEVASHIQSVQRFDIEGDGTQEVLIHAAAWEPRNPIQEPGEYSVLLLRRLDTVGEVVTQTVRGVAANLGEPLFLQGISPHSVADLNGDGRLELIGSIEAYESWGFVVYDLSGVPVEALAVPCGV